MNSKLHSRKLWLAVAAMLFVASQVLLGGLTPPEGVDRIRDIAVAYLGAQGLTDVAGALKGV